MIHTWLRLFQAAGLLVFAAVIVMQWRERRLAGGRLIATILAWAFLALALVANVFGW